MCVVFDVVKSVYFLGSPEVSDKHLSEVENLRDTGCCVECIYSASVIKKAKLFLETFTGISVQY